MEPGFVLSDSGVTIRGKTEMKIVAKALAIATFAALAACQPETNDAAENVMDAAENEAESLENQAAALEEATENQVEAIENQAENVMDAAENKVEAMDANTQ